MSFALEYRRKLQQREAEALRVKKANEGFVSMPAERSSDTSGNRRRVLMALVIAGGVLAVFNSGGLVRYSYDLADNRVGQKLIEVSEAWHGMMRETRATQVMDHIRGSVAMAKGSSWQDLTFGFAPMQAAPPPSRRENPGVVPAKGEPLPERRQPRTPGTASPEGPVMRASVNPGF